MAEYRLLTTWRIAAPLHPVFDAVFDSLRWPVWWPGSDNVEQLCPGDANGIGSIRRYVWKGSLPYRLSFDALTTRVEIPRRLEAIVSGDLAGRGLWTFSHEAGITTVRHEWCVRTTKHWMNAFSLLARNLFANNHHALMHKGGAALALHLNAPLVDTISSELPDATRYSGPARLNWAAAVIAGIVAGIIATLIQMALWWVAFYSPFDMLLRDSRLAAAIILGRDVLPPPAPFDLTVIILRSRQVRRQS